MNDPILKYCKSFGILNIPDISTPGTPTQEVLSDMINFSKDYLQSIPIYSVTLCRPRRVFPHLDSFFSKEWSLSSFFLKKLDHYEYLGVVIRDSRFPSLSHTVQGLCFLYSDPKFWSDAFCFHDFENIINFKKKHCNSSLLINSYHHELIVFADYLSHQVLLDYPIVEVLIEPYDSEDSFFDYYPEFFMPSTFCSFDSNCSSESSFEEQTSSSFDSGYLDDILDTYFFESEKDFYNSSEDINQSRSSIDLAQFIGPEELCCYDSESNSDRSSSDDLYYYDGKVSPEMVYYIENIRETQNIEQYSSSEYSSSSDYSYDYIYGDDIIVEVDPPLDDDDSDSDDQVVETDPPSHSELDPDYDHSLVPHIGLSADEVYDVSVFEYDDAIDWSITFPPNSSYIGFFVAKDYIGPWTYAQFCHFRQIFIDKNLSPECQFHSIIRKNIDLSLLFCSQALIYTSLDPRFEKFKDLRDFPPEDGYQILLRFLSYLDDYAVFKDYPKLARRDQLETLTKTLVSYKYANAAYFFHKYYSRIKREEGKSLIFENEPASLSCNGRLVVELVLQSNHGHILHMIDKNFSLTYQSLWNSVSPLQALVIFMIKPAGAFDFPFYPPALESFFLSSDGDHVLTALFSSTCSMPRNAIFSSALADYVNLQDSVLEDYESLNSRHFELLDQHKSDHLDSSYNLGSWSDYDRLGVSLFDDFPLT